MGLPKRKNDIDVYGSKINLNRRQELLDSITKNDTYLPESILHDDLDSGMLDFVNKNFIVVSDGKQIPIIKKIFTIQRWGELTENWDKVDGDNNLKIPFIGVVRKPDPQPGTNPAAISLIPDRLKFHYATVPTWDGSKMGANVYKIPQPIPINLTYDVTIVCNKFRDLNKFNKIIMQKFASIEAYTIIKGHYIPIILDKIEDATPISQIENRRFYVQNYTFKVLGFLIDEDEFEVKPAISRSIIMTDIVAEDLPVKKEIQTDVVNIQTYTKIANGTEFVFSVGQSIGILFYVNVNGLIQEQNVSFYHIGGTSKISFVTPPSAGDVVSISYYVYPNKRQVCIDQNGFTLTFGQEYFTYDGTSLTFTTSNFMKSIITVDINGLIEVNLIGYEMNLTNNGITLLTTPVVGSRIGISYLF